MAMAPGGSVPEGLLRTESRLSFIFPCLAGQLRDPWAVAAILDENGRPLARLKAPGRLVPISPEEAEDLRPHLDRIAAAKPGRLGPEAAAILLGDSPDAPSGLATFPLTATSGRILGCLAVGPADGGDLEESDRARVEEFAGHLAAHLSAALESSGSETPEQLLANATAAEEEARHERRVREQLEIAKRDWESTFDSIRDGILILDGSETVMRVNRAVQERLGREFKEIVGRPLDDVLGERGAASLREALGQSPEERTAVGLTALEGIFEISAYPRDTKTGGDPGSVVVLMDVTEKECLREQLLHSEKLSALGELISGIAHELNNPLTAVLGYAQILGMKDGDRFGKELAHLREEAMRASRIVRNLLTFARRSENRREPEDLNEVVRRTLSLREYDLRVHDITVEFDLAPSLPRSMMDRGKLQQVVLNLMNNAEYAIRSAGGTGKIRIRTEQRDDTLVLAVEDDGPGVPPKLRSRIFNPFFTTKPVGAGTGLGLPICFGIVGDHGGRIHVEGGEDGGARFVVELPVTHWDPSAGGAAADTAPEARAEGAGGVRILLVDDEESIRALGQEYLTGLGHHVSLAGDGEEALALLAAESFDVVLCDLRMPRLSGQDLYRQVLGVSPRYRNRFVFISGDPQRDSDEMESVPLLPKPFDLEELDRAVTRAAARA